MLFCFFWTGQFILALGEIIFAMAGETLIVYDHFAALYSI